MLVKDCYNTLNIWLNALEQYSFEMLRAKPSQQSWSMGQVYMHLYSETNYYFEQANICLHNNDDTNEEITATGKLMFANNAFPDELIEGPPENASVPQPGSKEELKEKFQHLNLELQAVEKLLSSKALKGKTRHPGLGYFSATEWVQFADMHLRHHLRQKDRIDKWLQTGYLRYINPTFKSK